MITGAGISFVGTIVGATAQSINQMIVSGVLFGLGSGFQEMGYAACQEIVPNKYRMWAVGIFDVMGIIAQSGPIVAYSFIAKTEIGWRGAYWYSESSTPERTGFCERLVLTVWYSVRLPRFLRYRSVLHVLPAQVLDETQA
jgi:MFS family permease